MFAMEIHQAYYLIKMKEALSMKQRNNPYYSLRAFARDIGIHPATLSQIINGKRNLPKRDCEKVLSKLNLSPKEKNLFIESLKKKNTITTPKEDDDHRFLLDESYFKIISEWEHFAVLELFNLPSFQKTKEDIAQRLDLNLNRVEVVISNLLWASLISVDKNGQFYKIHSDVKTTDNIKSQALRDSHKETMLMGIQKIDEIEIELRDFSSLTLVIDPQKINEAKQVIKEFRKKMTSLSMQDNPQEVYQLDSYFLLAKKVTGVMPLSVGIRMSLFYLQNF